MPTTYRDRISDRLLHTGVQLGVEREQMIRSLRAAARTQHDYERAVGHLMLAGLVDSLLIWLAARLRPRSALRYPMETS